jgi:hypothetical protein
MQLKSESSLPVHSRKKLEAYRFGDSTHSMILMALQVRRYLRAPASVSTPSTGGLGLKPFLAWEASFLHEIDGMTPGSGVRMRRSASYCASGLKTYQLAIGTRCHILCGKCVQVSQFKLKRTMPLKTPFRSS